MADLRDENWQLRWKCSFWRPMRARQDKTRVAPRLKVLYVIDRGVAAGGAERFAIALAMHLPRDRFDPWVCTTRRADDATVEALASAGIAHVHLGRRTKWDIYRLGKLFKLLRKERFQILHTHKFGSNLWGTLIGRACGVPVIVAHEHTWSYDGNPLRKWLDGRVIGRLATRFVAVSAADRERMISLEGVPSDKTVVIPTGYVPSGTTYNTDLRAELGIQPSAPLIGVAAVLRPQKRLDVLLEAYVRVRDSVPDAHLVIAGSGQCQDDLEQLATRLGVASTVHFLGVRRDVDDIMRAVDVGVLSSDFEGSPLFAFECMASGTPLIATAVGGLPDIVEHGRTGVLVPRRDSAALADAVADLLGDSERRGRFGAAARERIEQFTIQTTAARFAELYDALFDTSSS
jgi:glycosyltransferase involved in cell wall biosynthesis